MLLGVTGGICTGKNAAAALLEKRGFAVIDVDKSGHAALARCSSALASAFGPEVLKEDGEPDRARIGGIVFGNPEKLALLESIVHPAMFALVDEFLATAAQARGDCAVNAAILYAMPQARRCDLILELRAPFLVRYRRFAKREGKGMGAFLKRLSSQRRFAVLARAFRGKIRVVRNAAGLGELEAALDRALASIRAEARKCP